MIFLRVVGCVLVLTMMVETKPKQKANKSIYSISSSRFSGGSGTLIARKQGIRVGFRHMAVFSLLKADSYSF
jgi:hypothetical protein